MLLHKDKAIFQEFITATANDLGLQNFQVEKDYYVSLFLKELAKINTNVKIVFKGGTSLSKCYSVIDRFSEDIDLAVLFKGSKVTQGERKQLKAAILNVIEKLGMTLLNESEVLSRRDFNGYQIAYPNSFHGDTTMLPHIMVETFVVHNPSPCLKLEVSNYITKFLIKTNETQFIPKYELDPFMMIVQSIERTLIDKLFAICDYHLEGKYNRYSRHIYDIHMIWTSKRLDVTLMKSILDDVVRDRQLSGTRTLSCQPGKKPNEILKEIVEKNTYEDDYNDITSKFIYKLVSYRSAIKSLKEIIDLKILPAQIQRY
jgi:hypothetical protein